MSKQTAVEWLRDQITTEHEGRIFSRYEKIVNIRVFFNEALAMEREQIEEAYIDSEARYHSMNDAKAMAKHYYEETYGKEATNANG